MLLGADSSENHIKYSSCRYEILHSYEQTQTNLHFCQKQSLGFTNFSLFFVLLTWDILEIASEMDAIEGDFQYESNHVDIL